MNSTSDEYDPSLSADGLTLYFSTFRRGGVGGQDLWMATRARPSGPFSPPVPMSSSINTTAHEGAPSISMDGRSLYFVSSETGPDVLMVASRSTPRDPFSPAVLVRGDFSAMSSVAGPDISPSGLTIYLSNVSDQIWLAERTTPLASFGVAQALTAIRTPGSVGFPSISMDELALYFSSDAGDPDIWVATRPAAGGAWPAATASPVAELNTSFIEDDPDVSYDGSVILFDSDRPGGTGGTDIWWATRTCR